MTELLVRWEVGITFQHHPGHAGACSKLGQQLQHLSRHGMLVSVVIQAIADNATGDMHVSQPLQWKSF